MTRRTLRIVVAAASACVLAAGFGVHLSAASFTRSTAVPGNTVTVDKLANHFAATPGSNNQVGTTTPIVSGDVDSLALSVGTVPSARTFTQLFQVTNVTGQSQTAVVTLSGVPHVSSAVFTSSGTGTVTLASGASDWIKLTTSSQVAGHGAGTLRLALSGNSWLYRDYPLTIDEAPEAPTTLTATAHAAGHIGLSWPASSTTTNLTGYDVYRSSGGGAYAKLNASPLAATTYNDTATADGTAYSYKVRAVSSGATTLASVDTPVASTTADATAPASPTSVTFSGWINIANKTSVSVSVTLPVSSVASDTVTVTLSDGSHSVSGTAAAAPGTVIVGGLNVSSLNDGSLTIAATATDLAGNVSAQATGTAQKDTVAPAAPTVTAYTEGSSKSKPDTITVAAEAGSLVAATETAPGSLTVSGTATGGSVVLTLLAAQLGQTVTLSITATDAAGNVSTATLYTTTDQK